MATAAPDHAALMDRVYRGQRHIYDVTRKYFLFGRDRLIGEIDAAPGSTALELGCGTGRNLELIGRRWPGVTLYGLDISEEMLRNARKRLSAASRLVQGDATRFDPQALFGVTGFDRVAISYALSMIPDWHAALAAGADALAPGGRLDVVDFGDLHGLPSPARTVLRAWLTHFHVTPRLDLEAAAQDLARRKGLTMESLRGPLGYYRLIRLSRPT
ncbi:class I SAM-dependent methyltransferase [Novosphingobium sp. 9]|uniref:class I SAM-dependent methyltransferase n=1 Tax=Novosphingobium sp. 9 TaxID=2025349 RepID=UPI0021B50430|nr:class I SAM-dependent methyltransferase [Novosphingobium sp. 9]